jgi:hypothetical protein
MTGFVLPTYGMPCCGHRITQHTDEPSTWGQPPPACSCCRGAARLGAALLLMAETASDDSAHKPEEGTDV